MYKWQTKGQIIFGSFEFKSCLKIVRNLFAQKNRKIGHSKFSDFLSSSGV